MNNIIQFFKNGIKTLKREKFFALINVLGLSLGIFCFLLSAIYVKNELSHDQWHTNGENIYLPQQVLKTPNGSISILPNYAIGKAWVDESPGVINSVNISFAETKKYTVKEEDFTSDLVFYSTSQIFEVFDFGLKLGNEAKALEDPTSVVISSELSEKHFRSQNPLGELIEIEGLGSYKVAGVLNKIPSNSHLNFDIILPIDFTKGTYKDKENDWSLGAGLHYIQLAEGYSLDKLAEDTNAIYKKGTGREASVEFRFLKFTELYMNGTVRSSDATMFGGSKKYIAIFSVIGALMLLVASFNYINLTTSRAFTRSKDLAIRKVVGAGRGKIIRMQLGETLFLSAISLVLAIIALELLLPSINAAIGSRLDFDVQSDPALLLLPIGVLILIVAASGIYPAIIGSRFDMASLLKGASPKSKGQIIRKVLITLQFAICCGVLASALIIRSQSSYMINKDLGFATENVMSINLGNVGLHRKYKEVAAELTRSSNVIDVTGAPLPTANGALILDIGEGEDKRQEFVMMGYAVKGFVDFFDLKLLSGSSFENLPEAKEERSVLVNQAMLDLIGKDKEEALGYELVKGEYSKKIVGVLEDFHFSSTKSKISPLMIIYQPNAITSMSLKFLNGNKQEIETYAAEVWTNLGATKPFDYKLLENFYEGSFEREKTLIKIFNTLTIMIVVVASLGLFAIALLESQLKEKELSIRKVLGANGLILMKNLSGRFIILLIVSFLVAFPATSYLISGWLESFPYRINSTYQFFIVASAFVMAVAATVLIFQGVRVLKKNPASILRNE